MQEIHYKRQEQAVAVVVPTFDREGVLPRALDSVLGQSRPPAEVWVVD
ncbi:MAG: glycosyltransferase, partial [Acidobacteria bacterium]|nr:glycosyltransferase [Acidobacteriota bacterium]